MNKSKHKTKQHRTKSKQLAINNPSLHIGSGSFVPKTTRVSLRIDASIKVANDATTQSVVLSGNNMFDPLSSSGAEQPVGFDYWASMYDRYRVLGSRLKVQAAIAAEQKDSDTLAASAKVCVFPSNNTTSLTYDNAASQPQAKVTQLTTAMPKTIVSTAKTATVTGQKDVEGSDRLQALISAGPADEWFWRIVTVSNQNTTVNNAIILQCQLTYDVQFFDRQPLNRSSVTKYFRLAYLANVALLSKSQDEAKQRQAKAEARMKEIINQANLLSLESSDVESEYVPVLAPLIRDPSVRGSAADTEGKIGLTTPSPSPSRSVTTRVALPPASQLSLRKVA